MHVHVDQTWGQVEIQQIGGMTAVMEHVAEGLTHGVGHQLVAHHTAVDIEELLVSLAAGEGRPQDPATQAQPNRGLIQPQGVAREPGAEQPVEPLGHARGVVAARRAGRAGAARCAGARSRPRAGPGRYAGLPVQDARARSFRCAGTAPRRGVVEEVAHIDRGPGRMGGGARLARGTLRSDGDLERGFGAPGAGGQGQAADGGRYRAGPRPGIQGSPPPPGRPARRPCWSRDCDKARTNWSAGMWPSSRTRRRLMPP